MFLSHKEGFTLAETIMTLTVLSILLTFSLPILKIYESPTYTAEMSIFQYFNFIQDEINRSRDWRIEKDTLVIIDNTDRRVTISQYNQDIRRQVNGSGHELLIQDLSFHLISQKDHHLFIELRTTEGKTYEKIIYSPK
ncbi:ComGF family competence protein [Halobacillus massiliensis]|uniref:competence type IV pilus minor pilin ComGF n=1 Tax=Halobacillus massiliensis TaxID=1926286 RepID=UPI0009E36D3D